VKSLLKLHQTINIHALAHITGGGLLENIPRVLPNGTRAVIDSNSWQQPEVFAWLQEHGNVADNEMLRTFNCGVGMVVCVSKEDEQTATSLLQENQEQVWRLGTIESSDDAPAVDII